MIGKLLLAGAALLSATGAAAGPPSELGCIARGYTPEQQAQLDALLPRVDFLKGPDTDPALESFTMLVFGSVSGCAAKHGWTEADLQPAMLHEFGRLLELGFRRHGPFTAEQLRSLDASLATGDRTRLWEALEQQFGMGFSGADAAVSEENAQILGAFIVESGFGTEEAIADQLGVFLASMVMQRASAREFARPK